jgi:CheY-like chemotaxis protein
MIREFITEDLQEAGYQVLTASNAAAAVDILQARQDIRLVFTDVNMPGTMNGLQLAACVRDKWPHTHIVVTSGKCWPADKLAGALFVPKPYVVSNIIDIIGSFPGMRERPAERDTRREALHAQAFHVARSK